MPKVIFDVAAMKLAAERLAGMPIHAGPDGKMLAPGVVAAFELLDAEDSGIERWQPANDVARLLVLGSEACQDLVLHAERVDPSNWLRVAKNLTVPICSLADVVIQLQKEFNAEGLRKLRDGWPITDKETYKTLGRRIKKTRDGPVRAVRNKLAAHLDKDAIGDPKLRLDVDALLVAMGDSLVIAMLSLNHRAAFTWIRPRGTLSDGSAIVETMFEYPACVSWHVDENGYLINVVGVRLGDDPLHLIREELLKAAESYNKLVTGYGRSVRLIRWLPTEELRRAEQGTTSSGDEP